MPSPSKILTVSPEYITGTDSIAGAVPLGIIDGLAYVHVAPEAAPVRLVHTGGNLIDAANYREVAKGEALPEDAIAMVVGEQPPFPWGDDYTLIYDPSPAPFAWDVFTEAMPELAEQLMPHQWAGE